MQDVWYDFHMNLVKIVSFSHLLQIIKYTSQDTDTIKSNLNSISENFFAVNEYLLAELNSCRVRTACDDDD